MPLISHPESARAANTFHIAEKRKAIVVSGDKDVPPIKRRGAIAQMTVERIVSCVYVVSVAAGVGESLGPGIGRGQFQIAFAFGRIKLQTIVVRIGIRKTHPDLGETLIRS